MDSSISTLALGDAARPSPAIRSTSSTVLAMPEPRPPMVNDWAGRPPGKAEFGDRPRTPSMVKHTAAGGFAADLGDDVLNICRSSPRWMASKSAPIISTP